MEVPININLPYNSINNSEFLNCLNISTENDNPCSNFEISNEISSNSVLQDQDLDLNLAFQTDCKYYSVSDFYNLKTNKYFNIFHTNINSLELKFDNLHQFVSNSSSKIDVLAITESSQKTNENFKKNVNLDGYDLYKTPSN